MRYIVCTSQCVLISNTCPTLRTSQWIVRSILRVLQCVCDHYDVCTLQCLSVCIPVCSLCTYATSCEHHILYTLWRSYVTVCVRYSACTLQCVSSWFCRSVMSLDRHFVRIYVIRFLKSDDFLHVEFHSHNEMNSKSQYDQFQDFYVL